MEAAIRNALSRVENPDETQRARIYRTAHDALIRNLETRGITNPELVRPQVSRLKDLISVIEREYQGQAPMSAPHVAPAAQPDGNGTAPSIDDRPAEPQRTPDIRIDAAPTDPSPVDLAPAASGTAPRTGHAEPDLSFSPAEERAAPAERAPRIDIGSRGQQRQEPPAHAAPHRTETAPEIIRDRPEAMPVDDGLTLPPPRRAQGEDDARRSSIFSRRDKTPQPDAEPVKGKKPRRREKHRFASAFSSLVLLSFLGMGVWWLYSTGALDPDWDTSVPNPPPTVSSEDFSGDGSGPRRLNPESGFSGNWTTIYAPRDNDAISTGSLASAEFTEAGNGRAIVVTSASPGEDGEVALPIDAAALNELAGRASVIALTVRAAGDQPTAFYVTCDFGTMGDCGRRRFNAESQASDALIEVDFTRAMAPNSGGTISINSDVGGNSRAVELFGIRIRPAN
ncbi:hypothetical protein E2A64_03220 [Pseudohoeflea suaedae]|uniref:Uncharacterized protein n=1 Tax=Pseudohoeflea suaedae TaxID=877384 RepID=A0A4R5PNG5_9HYPH|nr:hypothetical protein [Pseudohoeflea suaedae]TDH38151.1 hypothetical protein E2A64_03220 [Pseudohoeflea suaedae]